MKKNEGKGQGNKGDGQKGQEVCWGGRREGIGKKLKMRWGRRDKEWGNRGKD